LAPSAVVGEEAVGFLKDVAPIFEVHCVRCHTSHDPSGELDLTRAEKVIGNQDSDAVVVPKMPDASSLLEMISGEEPSMPEDGPPLSVEQVDVLRRWVEQGANWPDGKVLADKSLADTDWWSLQPIEKPAEPELTEEDRAWVRTPVDAFVMAKLRENGLSPSAEATRGELIRRLYFDLIGLPPQPEEVDAFVADQDPQAYENLVEKLLGSERYGERWARHWLDVVHYGDTHGFDKDKVRPHSWPYRDYVVRAFNEDRAYDQFVREQLAGDVFYPESEDGIVALGFIAAGPFDWVGQIEVAADSMEKKRVRNLDRDDMVRNTIETFCSATIGCARCHNHKFDPFTSEDYYSLQAVFAAVDRADRPYGNLPEVESRRSELRKQRSELAGQISKLKKEEQTEGLADLEAELAEVDKLLGELPKEKLVFAAATKFAGAGQFQPTGGSARAIHLLQRGSVAAPLQQVGPGTIAGVIEDLPERFAIDGEVPEDARRAALADWILHDKNPLTWRSIVNRVWYYHFGRGIVDTPSDLGRMGTLPTHPQLLDWLAVTFRDGGRSIKQLHRLIVNSATYRQSSDNQAEYSKADGGNRFLWRMNRRRLEVEAIRDTMLQAVGKLDLTMYGPGFRVFGFEDDHSPRYKYEEYDPNDASTHRRSIYRFVVRSAPDPFMETLDCADPSTMVAKRNETLTPLQSLALLNNQFAVRMAEFLAERIQAASERPEDRVELAMRLTLGRSPSHEEAEVLSGLAAEHGWANMCRLIFNTNEFVFVD